METHIGKVTHYFNHLCVAVLELTEELKVGDSIHVLGRNTDFDQRVGSLEIEHHKIQSAGPGRDVALRVIEPVHEGDMVFKTTEE